MMRGSAASVTVLVVGRRNVEQDAIEVCRESDDPYSGKTEIYDGQNSLVSSDGS